MESILWIWVTHQSYIFFWGKIREPCRLLAKQQLSVTDFTKEIDLNLDLMPLEYNFIIVKLGVITIK